jgi:hypothetical protein
MKLFFGGYDTNDGFCHKALKFCVIHSGTVLEKKIYFLNWKGRRRDFIFLWIGS